MIEYKGYTGVFEFDPDLSLFAGHVVDLRDEIYFEGESVAELEASMRRAVDHYVRICRARGEEPDKPFSGNLQLRIGGRLHRAAAVAAAAEGESLNTWLVRAVEAAASAQPGAIRESTAEPYRAGTARPERPTRKPKAKTRARRVKR